VCVCVWWAQEASSRSAEVAGYAAVMRSRSKFEADQAAAVSDRKSAKQGKSGPREQQQQQQELERELERIRQDYVKSVIVKPSGLRIVGGQNGPVKWTTNKNFWFYLYGFKIKGLCI